MELVLPFWAFPSCNGCDFNQEMGVLVAEEMDAWLMVLSCIAMLLGKSRTGGGAVQVDLISFQGPTFSHVDNRVAALRLVQKGLCDAALFNPSGIPSSAQP